jgi:hypothetical protein
MADGNVTIEVIENPIELAITESNIDVIVNETLVEVSIGTSGPQGPSGQIDPTALGYAHTQNIASDTWNITHGLGFIPNITVVDSGGTVVEGSYNYPNANTVVLSFSSSFSGKAYLS